MALLGLIAKTVGAVGLEDYIETACEQLEQFVRGMGNNKSKSWTYRFTWKGKTLGTISANIKKSKDYVTFKVSGLPAYKLPLSGISESCKVAVHGAIALL